MVTKLILTTTILCTALITGLLYAYSCSVNIGLSKLPNKEYLTAMQEINKAIINPLFFISFMGALVLLPINTLMQYNVVSKEAFLLLLLAAILYAVGVFGVTMFGNVPLNNQLESFDLSKATNESLQAMRNKFETGWNRFHTIRTIASIISLLLLISAFIFQKKPQ